MVAFTMRATLAVGSMVDATVPAGSSGIVQLGWALRMTERGSAGRIHKRVYVGNREELKIGETRRVV